ncbi:DUF296 domain-containing protein [Desulfonema ishimotonii]|uniref:DUF296 domain-containing protein n=1 Tax=Desulfonema ishimotonii TaxID=45657 RepID=A0A401G1N3_9BACT|nr:PPC domain-containing DNA-binding protein [Desulfonema ishimotonii]GBC63148.1 DUF296 domain-containing protein [Desulfonema ishimotonii]
MEKIMFTEYTPGRCFLGQLPKQADLITSLERLCADAGIRTAAFSVMGSVTSYTIGTYDPQQQVYVTFTETSPREIVSCRGNISLRNGNPVVSAHIILADQQGHVTAGHLFSETRVFAGEIEIRERTRFPVKSADDPDAGNMADDMTGTGF